jgi:hypothetical protein
MKKEWKKPELKVFTKGKAEEQVLGICKQHGSWFNGGPVSLVGCGSYTGYFCQYNNVS